MPNPSLDSLLRPQKLDRSPSLLSRQPSAQARSGATPCERQPSAASGGASVRTLPSGPSLSSSGAGPGEYSHFMPIPATAAPPGKTSGAALRAAPAAAAAERAGTQTPVADRPLFGGNDRPLWNDGAPRAGLAAGSVRPGAPAAPGSDPAALASGEQPALPVPPRDRPLWAERNFVTPATPDAGPIAGGRAAAPAPCATSTR
ncbi:MAG: hypothetical protein RQ966_08550 [Acetobacteraceae bacterium]|nr:hypothetical protein [Acetobacteraceae bacterium]